jgi:hypothetical protein
MNHSAVTSSIFTALLVGPLRHAYLRKGGPALLGRTTASEVPSRNGRVLLTEKGGLNWSAASRTVYLVYKSTPTFVLTDEDGPGQFALVADTRPSVLVPGTVYIDLPAATAEVVLPPDPMISRDFDPLRPSQIAIGVIPFYIPPGGWEGGPGGVFNPDDGPSDEEIARGIVGAVFQTMSGAPSGFIGTGISMAG